MALSLGIYPHPVSDLLRPIKMLKVGLTGGIGSGKSFVADVFEGLGANLIDADVFARKVVEPGQPALLKIAEHFGRTILLDDGTLNRALLRKKVFANMEEKKWLESLLHPLIRHEIETQLNRPTKHYHLLVSPLLFETDQDKLVSRNIVIDVPVATQLKRSCKRDQSSIEDIQRIIDSQIPRQERLARANYVIDNSGTKAATIAQVEQLHQQLLHL